MLLLQGHSTETRLNDVNVSQANDENVLDQSSTHSAGDASAVVSLQLKTSLSTHGSHIADRLLTEASSNCNTAVDVDQVEATIAAAGSHVRCWTSAGFVSDQPVDIAADHLQSLNVDDRLTSADSNCDKIPVSSSNQQLPVISGANLASVNHVNHYEPACQYCIDNIESLSASSEASRLFSCHECSIHCSKHFAHDSLHIVLHVVRHSEVDCSVFADASLTVVKNDIYHTKVIYYHIHATFCVVAVLKSVVCYILPLPLMLEPHLLQGDQV